MLPPPPPSPPAVLLHHSSNFPLPFPARNVGLSLTVLRHDGVVRWRVVERITGRHGALLEAELLDHGWGEVGLVVSDAEFFEPWDRDSEKKKRRAWDAGEVP